MEIRYCIVNDHTTLVAKDVSTIGEGLQALEETRHTNYKLVSYVQGNYTLTRQTIAINSHGKVVIMFSSQTQNYHGQ